MPPVNPNVTPVPQRRPQQQQAALPPLNAGQILQTPTSLGQLVGGQMPVTPAPTPQQAADLERSWLDALNDPAVKSGLMQFAITALQPIQPGQSPLGQLANAVGAGGAQIGRVQELERQEAQTAEENRREQERLRLQGEQIAATREQTAATDRRTESAERVAEEDRKARKELEAAKDAAALERVRMQTDASYAQINALNKRLEREIEANREAAALAADNAMWEAAMTFALDSVDPDAFSLDTPEGRAEYEAAVAQAARLGVSHMTNIDRIRQQYKDPSTIPDETLDQSFDTNGATAAATWRAFGYKLGPEARAAWEQRIVDAQQRHQERLAAAQAGQQTAPAPEQPERAVGIPAAPATAEEPPAARGRRGRTVTVRPVAGSAEEAASTMRANQPGTEPFETARAQFLQQLPEAIRELSNEQFEGFYENNSLRAALNEKYGPELVAQRKQNIEAAKGRR